MLDTGAIASLLHTSRSTEYSVQVMLVIGRLWNKFFKATAFDHYDDLKPLLQEVVDNHRKYACVIICDNRPNWKKFSVQVMLVNGRLWRDLNLDYLCLVPYYTGDSRYNMIKYAWVPCTNCLTGLFNSQ